MLPPRVERRHISPSPGRLSPVSLYFINFEIIVFSTRQYLIITIDFEYMLSQDTLSAVMDISKSQTVYRVRLGLTVYRMHETLDFSYLKCKR